MKCRTFLQVQVAPSRIRADDGSAGRGGARVYAIATVDRLRCVDRIFRQMPAKSANKLTLFAGEEFAFCN